MRPPGPRNVDNTSHSSKAVQGAEVTVSAGLRKSAFVNRARVRKDSRVTIHVIGEQNCPSAVQGVPLVTLWSSLPQVHRTVSPTEMFNVSGTKRILFPDGPTATSKT